MLIIWNTSCFYPFQPRWVNKAAEGRYDDIRPCIGCGLGCGLGCGRREGVFTCAMNPVVGQEADAPLSQTEKTKSVAVVGGGPAGLEAARVAALRGHQVTLFEKNAVLGGQLNLAAARPMKQEITKVIQYLSTQAKKAGVEIQLNTEVLSPTLLTAKPDVLVIATGAKPCIPDLPGIEAQNIVTAFDVLAGKISPVSGNVLIVGGGMVGSEVADFISSPGYGIPGKQITVTIAEMLSDICCNISGANRMSLIKRLQEKKVSVQVDSKVIRFGQNSVVLRQKEVECTLWNFDTIILALCAVSNENISAEITSDIPEVYVIGDAKEPRMALEAIAEGAQVGRQV